MINIERNTLAGSNPTNQKIDPMQYFKCLNEIKNSVVKQIASCTNEVMSEKLRMHLQVINRVMDSPLEDNITPNNFAG